MSEATDRAMALWREACGQLGDWKFVPLIYHDQAAAAVIARALEEAREEERARVVEWLRAIDGAWPRATAHAEIIADAIKSGDHLEDQA